MYSTSCTQGAEKSVDPPNLKQSMCEAKAWWMGLDNWSMEVTQWKSTPNLSLCPSLPVCLSGCLYVCLGMCLLWFCMPWQRAGTAPDLLLDCCEEEKEEGAEVCRLKGSWMGWLTPRAAYSITVAHNNVWWNVTSNGMVAPNTCAAPERSALQEAAESSYTSDSARYNGANPWTLLKLAVAVDIQRKQQRKVSIYLLWKLTITPPPIIIYPNCSQRKQFSIHYQISPLNSYWFI